MELHPEPPEACIDPPEQLVRPRDALRMVVVMAAEGEAVHDNAPTNGNLVYSEKALHVLCEIYISAEELGSSIKCHGRVRFGNASGTRSGIFALSAHVKCV